MSSIKPLDGNKNLSNLEQGAKEQKDLSKDLHSAGDKVAAVAKHDLQQAGDHLVKSGQNIADAAINAAQAVGQAGVGVAAGVVTTAHVGVAAGAATVGVAVKGVEVMAQAGSWVASNIAKGFAAIANRGGEIAAEEQTVTTQEITTDPQAKSLSEKIFAFAGDQMNKAGETAKIGVEAYGKAIDHTIASAEGLVKGALHAAGFAGNMLSAAVIGSAAAVVRLAEFDKAITSGALLAAQAGVEGARELAILGAKGAAQTANALNQLHKDPQTNIQINLEDKQQAVQELINQRPALQEFVPVQN